MNFVSPGLLYGALAIAVPLIIFLMFRKKYKPMDWAAMEFLLRAQRRTNKRLQIENLLLLLIRCLILALLALALARPKVQSSALPILGAESIHHIIVIDTSYSMSYVVDVATEKTVLARAHARSHDLVKNMNDEDEVSVLRMGKHPELVVENYLGKDQDGFIEAKITESVLTHGAADFASTLVKIREVIDSSAKENHRVYFLTDFQASTFFTDKKKEEVADVDSTAVNTVSSVELLTKELSSLDNLEFQIINLGEADAANQQIQSLKSSKLKIITDIESNFVVELYNYSANSQANYELIFKVDGEEKDRQLIADLVARERMTAMFRHSFEESGFHYVSVEVAERSGDLLRLDDQRYLAVEVLPNINVLTVNGEVENSYDDEVFYLNKIMGVLPSMEYETVLDADLSADSFDDFDVIIMCNVASLDGEVLKALDTAVREQGKSVIWFLGDQVDSSYYNSSLYANGQGLLPAQLSGVLGDPGEMEFHSLAPIVFDHPILSYYAEPPYPIFFKASMIFQYYGVEDNEADAVITILPYDNKDPAVLEKSIGRGKSVLWTSTADVEWTDLAKQKIFLPLMNDMISYLAYRSRSDLNLGVTQRIVREYSFVYSDNAVLMTPQRSDVQLDATATDKNNRRIFFDQTDHVGIYHLFAKLDDERSKDDEVLEDMNVYFSVNLAADEGDLTQATEQQLRIRFPDFSFQYIASDADAAATVMKEMTNSGQELWKWFAWAVLFLLCAESFLGMYFGRYKKVT